MRRPLIFLGPASRIPPQLRQLCCNRANAPPRIPDNPSIFWRSIQTWEGIMRFRAALMLAALLVVTSAGAVLGQGFQGGLRGSLKDSGGIVPGVEVTLTNEQTNISRSTVTNDRGEYA